MMCSVSTVLFPFCNSTETSWLELDFFKSRAPPPAVPFGRVRLHAPHLPHEPAKHAPNCNFVSKHAQSGQHLPFNKLGFQPPCSMQICGIGNGGRRASGMEPFRLLFLRLAISNRWRGPLACKWLRAPTNDAGAKHNIVMPTGASMLSGHQAASGGNIGECWPHPGDGQPPASPPMGQHEAASRRNRKLAVHS